MKNLQSNIKENTLFLEIGCLMDLETEKAVKFQGEWLPKSQILHIEQENGDETCYTNYIPLWLWTTKNFGYADAVTFQKIKEIYREEKNIRTEVKVQYYKYLNKKGTMEVPCRIYTRSDGKSYFQYFKLDNGKFEIDFKNYQNQVFDIEEYEKKNYLVKVNKEEIEKLINIMVKDLYRNK